MTRLLKKVTDLEEKVTDDTTQTQNKGKRLSVMKRLNQSKTQTSDIQSNNSSDKVSNAKQLLGQLFKKNNKA